MPTYEYVCLEREHRFEVFQRIGDEPVATCPECGSAVRKVFHPVGVVLKGSGFYKTDSRGQKPAGKPPEGSSEKKKASGSSSEGGGTKGEKKESA